MRMTHRARAAALLMLPILALAAACGSEEPTAEPTAEPPSPVAGTAIAPTGVGADVPANVFANGSFESGGNPWISLTTEAWGTPFSVSSDAAHSGEHSALLQMRAGPDDTGTKVFGVVQEVAPEEFPEVLSGYYHVSDWERGTEKQYLQFVVIVWGATNLPGGFVNHQIRYPLAGISEPPFVITNAKFLFISSAEPQTDGWVYFQRPIRQDFENLWGAVPTGFSSIRILFETRYDDKTSGSEFGADILYDDLYLGPADADPNQPD
jgi:hypothetical protein